MKRALKVAVWALIALTGSFARGQELPSVQGDPTVATSGTVAAIQPAELPATTAPSAVQLLRDFKESDVKFELGDLMDLLRDRRHEGWVLAAYPDPKTGQPLIGAGFSLDLPAREHLQRDPLNPHPFLEPSSAELWEAAGLEPQRLTTILGGFSDRLSEWGMRKFRKQIRLLDPEISDDDASLLLRIGAIQAIVNARAYCRGFDQLSASQQMALSQLVYQMGVNLEEFSQFLGLINAAPTVGPGADPRSLSAANAAYWKSVQQSLVHSQWARLYRVRALSVIAMLDPRYSADPHMAERRIGLTLRPAVLHRQRGRAASARNLASAGGHAARPRHGRSAHRRTRRTV